MIEPEILERALREALASGGQYADAYIERRASTFVALEDRKIEKLSTGLTAGVGLRLIFGKGKTAYAITNDLSEPAIMELARSLRAAAAAGGQAQQINLKATVRYPATVMKRPPSEVPASERAAMLMEADRVARATGQGAVRQVSVMYRDSQLDIQVATSEGRVAEGRRVHIVSTVSVIAERDGVMQTGYEPVGGAMGYELFEAEPLHLAAERATARALAMLGARRAPGGRMPVVISSEAGGTMIHEAIGHGLEADLAGQGLSKFSGKIGQPVASRLVSVVDDPTLPGRRGSYNFDDEGTEARRTELVREGVLVAYMSDKLSSIKYGIPTSGNGRRETYASRPIPRMSNTFIAPGGSDPESILRATDRGLLVKKMGGGQVNTVNGDFVFDVSEGYLIEGGRVGELVRGATLTGNGPEVLMSIDMVGSDLGFAIGTCGKDGQGVPVSDAMPTVRIPDMVVGGEV